MSSNFWDDDATPVGGGAPAPAKGSFWDDDATPTAPSKPQPPGISAEDSFGTKALDAVGNQLQLTSDAVLGGLSMLPGVGMLNKATAAVSAPLKGQDYNETLAALNKSQDDNVKRNPIGAGTVGLAANAMLPVGAGNAFERVGTNMALSAADQGTRGDTAGFDVQRANEAAKSSGKMSGLIEGAVAASGPLGKTAAYLTAGLKPSTIEKYRARREPINALNEADAAGELAQTASGIQTDARNIKTQALRSAKDNKTLARDREALEVGNLKGRAKADKDKFLAEADVLQRNAADGIVASFNPAQKKVSEGSTFAIESIADDMEVSVPYLKRSIQKQINDLKIGKDFEPSDSGYRALQGLRDEMNQFKDKKIPGAQLKRLVQYVDTKAADAYSTGAMNGSQYVVPAERAMKGVRQGFDKLLKRDENYAKAMEPVAEQTRALSGARDEFGGDGDAAYRALKQINAMGNQGKRKALEDYEAKFGGRYTKDLDEADALRSTDYDALYQPDIDKIRMGTRDQYRKIDDDLAGQLTEYGRKSGVARNLGTEQQAATALRKYGGDPKKNFYYEKRLQNLAKEKGEDPSKYTQMAEDLGVKNAMDGSYVRGSRNVNLGAFSIGGAANLLGMKGPAGQAVGAVFGAVADLVGAKPAKFIVDLVDSPGGQKFAEGYRRAMEKGPQAVALMHYKLMQTDPEYKAAYEQTPQK